MKRVVLFMLLFLSLTAPIIHAQGDDPEPLDVTSTFDYFQISYPEDWIIRRPVGEGQESAYYLYNDPDFQPRESLPPIELFEMEPDQVLIAIAIAPVPDELNMQDVDEQGLTIDYLLGVMNGVQIASIEDPGLIIEPALLLDRTIGDYPARSSVMRTNIVTIEQIYYFDEHWSILITVATAPGEHDNPTIDAILDSIELVNGGQKIGRLKQAFEGDLSGISMAAGTPIVIANEIEAQEITRDGITSNIWYEVEEICGTQSALMWSGAIQLEDDTTTETTYLDYCIEYVHEPDLPLEIISTVKYGIYQAYMYTQRFGVQLTMPVVVEINEVDETPSECGVAGYGQLTLYYHNTWCPSTALYQAGPREFFRVIQYALLGESNNNGFDTPDTEPVRNEGPAWLIEGMTQYLTNRALGSNISNQKHTLHLLPTMESYEGFQEQWSAYYIAAYAVSELVDGNDGLLFEYYEKLGQGPLAPQDWKIHFHDTFGISVEDFYEQEASCGIQIELMSSGSNLPDGDTSYLEHCIEYVHDPELPQEVIDEVKAGFERAYLYARQYDVQFHSPLTVEILEPDDAPTRCGSTDYGEITLYYFEDLCPLTSLQANAAHEFIHHIQLDQIGKIIANSKSGDTDQQGPRWLIEGMAEYLTLRMFGLNVPRRGESLHLLPEMETPDGFRTQAGSYDIAGFAVSLLTDGNDQLLFDYYASLNQSLNQGGTWKTHFEETFGISVEDFYARFE